MEETTDEYALSIYYWIYISFSGYRWSERNVKNGGLEITKFISEVTIPIATHWGATLQFHNNNIIIIYVLFHFYCCAMQTFLCGAN